MRKGSKQTEEAKLKISKSNTGKMRAKSLTRSETLKNKYKDPEYKNKVITSRKKYVPSKETKQKISESNKGRIPSNETRKIWSDQRKGRIPWNKGIKASDETIKKNSEAQKLLCSNPERIKLMSENAKKKWSEPGFKEWYCNNLKKIYENNPEKRHPISKETKLKISISNTGKHHSEETKQKLSVLHKGLMAKEKNPNWKGGTSFGKYCHKFDANFKEYIRNKFNRLCFVCGKSELDDNKHLFVHHIDYDKLDICNGRSWPFVPLCNSCHSKSNFNRWHWFNLLINYWVTDSNKHFNINFEVNL